MGSAAEVNQIPSIQLDILQARTAVCSRAPMGHVSAAAMAAAIEWPEAVPSLRSTSYSRASVPATGIDTETGS